MLAAIRTVGRGGRYITPEVRGVKMEGASESERAKPIPPTDDVLVSLTVRERDVLDLIVKGWRSRDIARELCVSIKTIETHRTRINRKLRCRSSADLIRFAADNGLLRPAPSASDGAATSRTILLVVDDDPTMRGELLRDVVAQGYRPARAPSVNLAIAEMREGQPPSMFVIDPDAAMVPATDLYRQLRDPSLGANPIIVAFDESATRTPIRVALSLPSPEAGEKFLAALDRAAALRKDPTAVATKDAHAA